MDMYQKRKMRQEKKNSPKNNGVEKIQLNWYPGHMAKTKNEVKKIMPLIDVVFELIDARIPYSSKMRDIDDIIKNKLNIKGEASFNNISKTIIDDVRMEYIKGITLDRNDN